MLDKNTQNGLAAGFAEALKIIDAEIARVDAALSSVLDTMALRAKSACAGLAATESYIRSRSAPFTLNGLSALGRELDGLTVERGALMQVKFKILEKSV